VKLWIRIALSAGAALAVVLAWAADYAANDYTHTIAANWRLSLPRYAEEVYTADSGDSWLGDGDRYHVVRYAKGSGIGYAVSWHREEDPAVTEAAEEILGTGGRSGLAGLNVPQAEKPDYADCRWFTVQHPSDDRNRLYLFLNGDTLYVVERFF
jgi:hypothetical protein